MPASTTDIAREEQPRLVTPLEDHYLYVARREDLRLTKVPRYPIHGQAGTKIGETKGEVLAFHGGTLRVPKEGTVRLEDEREIPVEDAIAWLNNHRLFGNTEEGFWVLDPAKPPISQAEQDRMFEAAMALDIDTLEHMAEQERNGWNRPDLLRTLDSGIERLRAALDAVPEESKGK